MDPLPRHRAGRAALGAAALAFVIVAACGSQFLAINPSSTPAQLCEGRFVTGEPLELCRRAGDGALGAYEIFIPHLVLRPSGELIFADRVTVGFAEATQTFDELDERSNLFWQLKALDNTLLQLQEIRLVPGVATLLAAGDAEVSAAVAFIEHFIDHYTYNDRQRIAGENERVFGIDDFLRCIGTERALRESVCYTLYDLAPASSPDGTLDQEDFKVLVAVLSGDDDAAAVGNYDFNIEQFFECKAATFNTDPNQPITPQCVGLDTNGNGTVDDLDLENLLRGNVPDNFPPVAVAGEDQEAVAGERVLLNGGASFDVETPALQFLWAQVSGSAVSVTGSTTAEASFMAPSLPSSSTLKFRLTVTDASGGSSTDIVEISVSADVTETNP